MIRDDAEMDEEIEMQLEKEMKIQKFNQRKFQIDENQKEWQQKKASSLPPNLELSSNFSTG
jgi:hypothetical protein